MSVDETRFDRRGFQCADAHARARLETIGATFLEGYHAALVEPHAARLARALEAVEIELRGFAFEGAAMGLTLLDALTPWRRNRWATLLAGPGEPYAYMIHVGAGWARARLGGDPERVAAGHDPLLRWLVFDGWGFHDGYFRWPVVVERREIPARLGGYARNAYDQGLGRAIWFVRGADVDQVSAAVHAFELERQGDLWSGVGLAAAYAGGSSAYALTDLRQRAGEHRAAMAQGVAFAAEARRRAFNPSQHTELACQMVCGMSAIAAADTTTEALQNLPTDDSVPTYETWRRAVQSRLLSRLSEPRSAS